MEYVARVVHPPHNADHKGSALHFPKNQIVTILSILTNSFKDF